MLSPDDFLMLIPEGSQGQFLPSELLPGFPYLVALAPAERPGTAAELVAGTHGAGVMGIFTCDADCVGQAFRSRLVLIKGYLAEQVPVAFCCATKRDRAEARRRLAAICPAGFSIRE